MVRDLTIFGVTMVTGVPLLAQAISANKSAPAISHILCRSVDTADVQVAGLIVRMTPATWDPPT
jgi:hypothetical protein